MLRPGITGLPVISEKDRESLVQHRAQMNPLSDHTAAGGTAQLMDDEKRYER